MSMETYIWKYTGWNKIWDEGGVGIGMVMGEYPIIKLTLQVFVSYYDFHNGPFSLYVKRTVNISNVNFILKISMSMSQCWFS